MNHGLAMMFLSTLIEGAWNCLGCGKRNQTPGERMMYCDQCSPPGTRQ